MRKFPSMSTLKLSNCTTQVRNSKINFLKEHTHISKIRTSRIKTEPDEAPCNKFPALQIRRSKELTLNDLQAEITSLYLNESTLINCFNSRSKSSEKDLDSFNFQKQNIMSRIQKERVFMMKKIKTSCLRKKEKLYLVNFFKSKTFENDIKITKIFNKMLEKDTLKGGLRTFLNSVENSKRFGLIKKSSERERGMDESLNSIRMRISRSIEISRTQRKQGKKKKKTTLSIFENKNKQNFRHYLPKKFRSLTKKKASLNTLASLRSLEKQLKNFTIFVKKNKSSSNGKNDISVIKKIKIKKLKRKKGDLKSWR